MYIKLPFRFALRSGLFYLGFLILSPSNSFGTERMYSACIDDCADVYCPDNGCQLLNWSACSLDCEKFRTWPVWSPQGPASSPGARAASTFAEALIEHPGVSTQASQSTASATSLWNEMDPNQSYLAQAGDDNQVLPSGSAFILAKGKDRNAFWAKGLYQNVRDNGLTANSYAGLLGYDFFYSSGSIGGAATYMYSVHRNIGHVNTVSAALRGTAHMPHSTYIEYGLIGAVNLTNFDQSASIGTIKSKFTAYTVDPYLNFGYDGHINSWLILEPFVRTQYIFSFENSFSQSGTGLSRMHFPQHNSGLFRLEPGLNFYEHWKKDWGQLVLRQKISYVRMQAMFGSSLDHVSFVDLGGDFTTSNLLSSQNYVSASAQILARFNGGAFISATYRGEWGNSFQLNEARLRTGVYF